MDQQQILESLPAHLRPFVQQQDYNRYTPRDQAVWRFVMKQLSHHLAAVAHPVYLEGLARTGIALDHIPSIDEMNRCLAALGWRAVVVDGFIPPAIFMEFQALKVLVIALDMRSVEQIFYTPAPDIVHESAGHAPFIVDIDYAEFLQRFGEVGMKAIASDQDFAVYEAIRKLSIIKQQPDSTDADIAAAEDHLAKTMAAGGALSEAALLTRLHWWTVEYGLVGEVDDYRLFGAGLLSSLGESRHCLDDDKVKKLPLTLEAIKQPYDITSEQPQLFVTRSCRHLSQVLEEFAAAMCATRGGTASLRTAIEAGSICTVELDTGLQISGRWVEVLTDAMDNPTYIRTQSPTQLAWRESQIYGHGVEAHPRGYGCPVGLLKDFSRCLSDYSVDELKAHNIALDTEVKLEFLSGITVQGILRRVHRQEHHNLLLSFDDCTVTDIQGRVLFDPTWGCYDMAVGSEVSSVFGGTADRAAYRLYEPTPSTVTPQCEQAPALMALYALVDPLGDKVLGSGELAQLQSGLASYPQEWLLRVELLNWLDHASVQPEPQLRALVLEQLQAMALQDDEPGELVRLALQLR